MVREYCIQIEPDYEHCYLVCSHRRKILCTCLYIYIYIYNDRRTVEVCASASSSPPAHNILYILLFFWLMLTLLSGRGY